MLPTSECILLTLSLRWPVFSVCICFHSLIESPTTCEWRSDTSPCVGVAWTEQIMMTGADGEGGFYQSDGPSGCTISAHSTPCLFIHDSLWLKPRQSRFIEHGCVSKERTTRDLADPVLLLQPTGTGDVHGRQEAFCKRSAMFAHPWWEDWLSTQDHRHQRLQVMRCSTSHQSRMTHINTSQITPSSTTALPELERAGQRNEQPSPRAGLLQKQLSCFVRIAPQFRIKAM